MSLQMTSCCAYPKIQCHQDGYDSGCLDGQYCEINKQCCVETGYRCKGYKACAGDVDCDMYKSKAGEQICDTSTSCCKWKKYN